MDRKITIISPELGQLFVSQISHELNNHNLYMSFANYFGIEGLTDLETYYRKRAHEEYIHYSWIMDYLTNGDYRFEHPLISGVIEKPNDYLFPFSATVKREIETTQLIYKIYELANEQKDFMTASWLYEKLIKEQIEEENTSRMAESIAQQDTTNWFSKAESILELLEN